jgi:hypothetical protein
MKRKDAYFGGAEIKANKSVKPVLHISSPIDGEITVHDAEIVDNPDSMEVVMFSTMFEGEDGEQFEVLIHKKDCLQLANFLLNIHTEYANRCNEMDFEFFKSNIKF